MATFTLEEILVISGGRLLVSNTAIHKSDQLTIVTDTRNIRVGELFLALKGENFDGIIFAEEAIEKGASGIILNADSDKPLFENIIAKAKTKGETAVIEVEDTLMTYQAIAKKYRDSFDVPVIAITGSNGKTTTKDIIAAIMAGRYGEDKVLKTEANFNNEIGLPLTLLQLEGKHKVAVVEMGMRGLGQIAELAHIANPNIGIVTNVGETHMELLGSIENIKRAKGELVEGLANGGLAILNADDENTLDMKKILPEGCKAVTFGIRTGDILAEGIRQYGNMLCFMVRYKNERHDYQVPLVGRHNIYNALAGIIAGLYSGLSPMEIQRGLRKLKPAQMRYEQEDFYGWKIINDAYNASPLSMKVAIETTANLYHGRKVAVLADMLELGEVSVRAHRDVGKLVADSGFEVILTYGNMGKLIKEGAEEAGAKQTYHGDTHEAVAKQLQQILQENDTVLFKGSRGMRLEEVIKKFKEIINKGK